LIANIAPNNPSFVQDYDGLVAAAKTFGFHTKWYVTGSTNDSLAAAFDAAKAAHPAAVWVQGVEPSVFAARWGNAWVKAGVPVVNQATNWPDVNDKELNYSPTSSNAVLQAPMGDWAVATANGAAANTLLPTPGTDFPVFLAAASGIKNRIMSRCPTCSVTVMNILLSGVGTTVPTQIVSFLQQNPTYKYVIFPLANGVTTGVQQAITGAGLTGIHIAVSIGGPPDLTAVKNGTFAVNENWSTSSQAYVAMDFFVRALTHQSTEPDFKWRFPVYIQTASDIGDPNNPQNVPYNWQQQFAKIWTVKK
jgi:ABC-type sugar transport system substrate-binding protein